MTRAKDHLHLIAPQRFFARQQRDNGAHHMYAARTRFIEASMLQYFAGVTWPVATKTIGDKPQPNKEPVNIGARLRGMWQ